MKTAAPAEPTVSRPAERPRSPSSPDREDFERLLDTREPEPDPTAVTAPPAPVDRPKVTTPVEDTLSLPTERADLPRAQPLAATPEPVAAAVAPLPDPSQAAWAQRVATPSVAPGEATRFEVIDPAAPRWLSSVDVQALGPGGVHVAVVAGAEQAALLDRHLPQLHRRLAARGVPHARVDTRDEPAR